MRTDLEIIKNWISPNSRILDLACGDGELLKDLKLQKKIEGYGLEIDLNKITEAISNNINVISTNLDSGLSQFSDKSFDTVIIDGALYHMYMFKDNLEAANAAFVAFNNGLKDLQTLFINNFEYIRDTRVNF